MPDAIIFDLDGVLMDSEQRWNEIKEALVRDAGGEWRAEAAVAMMGMSSPEWSAYLRDELGVPMDAEEISAEVVGRMSASYAEDLPLLPGAIETVRLLADRWPLGLASSSNREVIDTFLRLADVGEDFRATVSSEEVGRGKPSPDVYLEAARALGVAPTSCVAIEDSTNGLRAAAAAGMRVIAVPNEHYPPEAEAVGLAALTVSGVAELTRDLIYGLG